MSTGGGVRLAAASKELIIDELIRIFCQPPSGTRRDASGKQIATVMSNTEGTIVAHMSLIGSLPRSRLCNRQKLWRTHDECISTGHTRAMIKCHL